MKIMKLLLFSSDKSSFDKKYVPVSCCKYSEDLGNYVDIKNCQYFDMGPPNNPDKYSSLNKYLNYDVSNSNNSSITMMHLNILNM